MCVCVCVCAHARAPVPAHPCVHKEVFQQGRKDYMQHNQPPYDTVQLQTLSYDLVDLVHSSTQLYRTVCINEQHQTYHCTILIILHYTWMYCVYYVRTTQVHRIYNVTVNIQDPFCYIVLRAFPCADVLYVTQ